MISHISKKKTWKTYTLSFSSVATIILYYYIESITQPVMKNFKTKVKCIVYVYAMLLLLGRPANPAPIGLVFQSSPYINCTKKVYKQTASLT